MARTNDDAVVPDDLIDSGLPPSQAAKSQSQPWKPAPQQQAQAQPAELAMAKVDMQAMDLKVPVNEAGLVSPTNLAELMRFAQWVVHSKIVPAKTSAEAFVIMQRGAELGFKGLGTFDYIYVVKGRPRVSPAGIRAIALSSGLVEDYTAVHEGEGDKRLARVSIKRRGIPTPTVGTFSVDDAKRAKLWGKAGINGDSAWITYPDRMLMARASGFAWGDAFPDLAGGMPVREIFDRDEEEDSRMAHSQEPDKLLAEVVGQE